MAETLWVPASRPPTTRDGLRRGLLTIRPQKGGIREYRIPPLGDAVFCIFYVFCAHPIVHRPPPRR